MFSALKRKPPAALYVPQLFQLDGFSCRHVYEARQIEAECFASPWPAKRWRKFLRAPLHVGLGVGLGGHTVGYVVYRCTGGWQPGELSLIAARPSMGKTAFALNACLHAAEKGIATVFYSFEMDRRSILLRLVCLRKPVRFQQILRGELNPVERRYVTDGLAEIDSIPLRVVGASGRTVLAVRSHAERLARRGKCGMIALDYIGLVRSSDSMDNRNQQLGETCRQLKGLAVELGIPALVLAQLNRGTESRNDKRPMMSDLRDSGELEEHADLVALIHRPGYYDRKNPDVQLTAELIVAKQRNGDTPVIQLEFHRQSGRFEDPEETHEREDGNKLAFAG